MAETLVYRSLFYPALWAAYRGPERSGWKEFGDAVWTVWSVVMRVFCCAVFLSVPK